MLMEIFVLQVSINYREVLWQFMSYEAGLAAKERALAGKEL